MTENFLSFAMLQERLIRLLFLAPAFLAALTFHEVAHGAVANFLGDPTAKRLGRLSLNPIRHLDPLGSLMFLIAGIGWAKPVPVNGAYFARPRRDMALVSLAGPAANFFTAMVLGLALKSALFSGAGGIAQFVAALAYISIILGVFNLLPLPPLDGSRLVSAVLPDSLLGPYQALEGYGIAIIFIVIFVVPGGLFKILNPFIGFFSNLFLV
jgi:Zn-dependent protease